MYRSPNDTALEYVACLRTGDFERLVTLHHPDLVCSLLGTSGVSGRYRGRDAFFAHTFKHVLGKLAETPESYLKDYRIGCADEHCAALLLHGGLPTRNGGRYDQHYLQLFHVVDGLIVEIHELLDTVMLETQIFDRTLQHTRTAPSEPLRPALRVAVSPGTSPDLERSFSAALLSGDWLACANALHADAELQVAGSTPISGTVHGASAIARCLTDHVSSHFVPRTVAVGIESRLVCSDASGFCRLATVTARTRRGTAYQQIVGLVGSYRGGGIAALQVYFDTAVEEDQTFENPLSPASVAPSPEPFGIQPDRLQH
jgi:ketosteroid isomerase-like protein